MKHQKAIKIVSILLTMILLLGMLPTVWGADNASDATTILACSDFQAEAGHAASSQQVKAILAAMRADGITSADAFFACGDYDYNYTDSQSGIVALKSAVKDVVDKDMIFVQGNHDPAVNTAGLTYSGNHDPASGKYGVFVINEDDYMHYNERELMVQRTAQLLTEYLNEKLAVGFDKPIFVLSHLPLHYNMRTKNDGDTKYGMYLVDVLNQAAEKGLNLFFLFGHDHSNGWDDYLGGSSIYLKKGDSMLVSSMTSPNFVSTEIGFTYFNAGFTGYYSNVNGADDALTMTYITIKDNEVSIARYDKNGIHDMKSRGVSNADKNEGFYDPNETVYPSPQVIPLQATTPSEPIEDLLPDDTTLKIYRRVNALTELKDGGKYLIVYNSSTDRILLPEVVTKADENKVKRMGFQIELCAAFGGDTVYGSFEQKEWTFTKVSGGWNIGVDNKYMKLTKTGLMAITATLEDEGGVMRITGDRDAFVIQGGTYYLQYNSRLLFNGYANDPSHFYLYEAVGYAIDVDNGEASKTVANAGDTVTLTAKAAPEGMAFAAWEVTAGELTLSDPTLSEVTFTMPESGVQLKALYREASLADPVSKEGGNGTWIALIAVAAVVGILGGGAGTFLILKKKGA